MSDIELVIKINKDIAQGIIDGENDTPRNIVQNFRETIAYAIKNGTPLPKGHGRIADVDKILDEMRATRSYDILFALERVKPIIEADKESK